MTVEFWIAISAVFLAVGVVSAMLASAVLSWNAPGARRLRAMASPAGSPQSIETPWLQETPMQVLKKLHVRLPRSPHAMGRLQRRLTRAGYRSGQAVALYAAAELLMPVAGALTVWLFVGLTAGWIPLLLGAGLGYLLPGLWLAHKIGRRQREIRNGLPDALDLMIVCMEAGSSLDQAVMKSSEELDVAHRALAEELRLINVETRAGKPRLEAFKNFAARTGVDDVRSLVAMLVQTDRFGTSIGQALRTMADTLRTKRRQHAEERAAKIGVKLVFPLVFCLFPALFVVALGPAVIQYVRVFKGQIMQ